MPQYSLAAKVYMGSKIIPLDKMQKSACYTVCMTRVGNSKASIYMEKHTSKVSIPDGSCFISLTMQLG